MASYRRASLVLLGFGLLAAATRADQPPLLGFAEGRVAPQRALEQRFDASLRADDLKEWMRRLAARPHALGSPYGKESAEFLASLFRSWGYDTKIEEFRVLFPTPKTRVLEMVEPTRYQALISEPVLKEDATSGQALFISKNVWVNTFWKFNISRWRASDAPESATVLQQFDLSEGFGQGDDLAALPWRMCARVVGTTVSFVVWPLSQARPAPNDPAHSGSMTVPDDLMAPGIGAWYVGHLQPGENVVYDDLSVGPPGAT